MIVLYLYQFGPAIGGLLLAVVATLLGRRAAVRLPRSVQLTTGIGMVIAIASMVAFRGWDLVPDWLVPPGIDGFLVAWLLMFIVPLVLTVLALLVVILPIPTPGPRGSAELVPRTPFSFAPRRWLGIGLGTVLAVVVVAVLAGLASITDDAGRHVMYEVPASASTRGGTSIYGWWYSVPCMIAVVVLVVLVFAGLVLTSRPSLAADAEQDARVRTVRVRNILAVLTGGLLVHLGVVLNSLYGTSSMRLGFEAGPAGFVELGTSFAAIGPALRVAGFAAVVLGYALWWFVLLSAVTVPKRTSEPQPGFGASVSA